MLQDLLHVSFQEVNKLFVLAFDNTNHDDNKVERDSQYRQLQYINWWQKLQ